MTHAPPPLRTIDVLKALLPGRWSALVLGIGLSGLAAFALSLTPVSPTELWRADAALGSGQPALAVRHYDAVAEWSPSLSLRQRARLRGASALSIELGQAAEARTRLEAYVTHQPDHELAAAAIERIADLLLSAERRLEPAANSYLRAYRRAPQAQQAAHRLMAAAKALGEDGQVRPCVDTWQQVADRFPTHRARAWIHQAEQRLAEGNAQDAMSLFDDAARAAQDPDLVAVAKLGLTASLERLGNLDEAIAEVDFADLPGRAHEARIGAMRLRDALAP